MQHITEIPEKRPLRPDERSLVEWLLKHGTVDAMEYLGQLDRAVVIARCNCGCASAQFSVDDRVGSRSAGMNILADYEWQDNQGKLFGAFVFACESILSGLDLWSIDGLGTATLLPETRDLRPISR